MSRDLSRDLSRDCIRARSVSPRDASRPGFKAAAGKDLPHPVVRCWSTKPSTTSLQFSCSIQQRPSYSMPFCTVGRWVQVSELGGSARGSPPPQGDCRLTVPSGLRSRPSAGLRSATGGAAGAPARSLRTRPEGRACGILRRSASRCPSAYGAYSHAAGPPAR